MKSENRCFNIVSVGRLVEQKAYDRLVRLAKRLRDDNYNFHVTIIGEGEERNKLEGLIVEFNKMCDGTIKKYWGKRNKDYFSEIKEIFKYDFYANNETDLIEAAINDDKRVTLYKKVLEYLKTLTQYVEPQSAAEKYADLDTDTILNMGSGTESDEEKENSEKLKKLKRIALTFTALKKIDSDTESSYFLEYIDDKNLNNALTLKNTLESTNLSIDEIATSSTYKNKSNQETLKKYIGALEGITKKESIELRNICDKAIGWYTENSHKIDDGSIFEQFMELNWTPPTIVYKDTEPHDFYYIEKQKSPAEEMADALAEAKGLNAPEKGGDEPYDLYAGYDFNEDSTRTKYGINSYRYWLRYCTIATLVNCMVPIYWSTGFLIMGAPLLLPIIFIPIIVLTSRVILVIGIGLCGICPMPMFLLMNVSDIPGFVIPILNILVDMLKDVSGMVVNMGKDGVKQVIKGLIKQEDNKIDNINAEMKQIEMDIKNLKDGVGEDKNTLRSLRKKNGEDTTSKGKKPKDKNRKPRK